MIFKLLLINTVKSNKKNSESLIKIGQIIRKLWYFKVWPNFMKHRYWSQIKWANCQRDDVMGSQLSIGFVHKSSQISPFLT